MFKFRSATQLFDKLLGITLGLYAGGPAGAVVGVALGHAVGMGVRRMHRRHSRQRLPWPREPAPEWFYATCCYTLSRLVEFDRGDADTRQAYLELVMANLGLQQAQRDKAQQFLATARRPSFPLDAALVEFRRAADGSPIWVAELLDIVVTAAYVNGLPSQDTRRWVAQLANLMGCPPAELRYLHKREYAKYGRAYKRARKGAEKIPQGGVITEAYAVLGVVQCAADDEVTRAYRRLLSRFHPDKLMAQGASAAAVAAATEETKRIKWAYDTVRQARHS